MKDKRRREIEERIEQLKEQIDELQTHLDSFDESDSPFIVSHNTNVDIEELGLSVKVHNQLKRHDIKTIEQLDKLTKAEVLAIKGLGEKAWIDICVCLVLWEEAQDRKAKIPAFGQWQIFTISSDKNGKATFR